MFVLLEVLCVLSVTAALAIAVAQALELSSKLRVERVLPAGVQALHHPTIHNPVFTAGGLASEASGLAALTLMILAMPLELAPLGWAVLALCSLVAMHVTYWARMHPAHQVTEREPRMSSIAPVGFFATHPLPRPPLATTSWMKVRQHWEHSHALRVVLATVSLTALVMSVALR